jgi:hypothetical protein
VYVRLRNTSGNEEKFALGTIQSGGSFSLKVVNNYGAVSVEAFGNYLQSQNPFGNVKCGEPGNSSSFATCYTSLAITQSKVTMTDVSYIRNSRSNNPS